MIGIAGSAGSPFSPWQALQTDALSSTESAQAAVAAKRSAAITTLRNMNGNPSHRANAPPIARCAALGQTKKAAIPGLRSGGRRPYEARGLLDREGDDVVAALGVDLSVAARTDDDILLAVDHVGRRGRIAAGAGLELPEHFAGGVVVSLEPAVGFAGEDKPARGGENAADHGLRRLDLPGDFPGVVVDGGNVTEALLARDDRERAAEPEFAVWIGGVGDRIGHRLMQIDRISDAVVRIGREGRPLDAAIGPREHLGGVGVKRFGRGRQRPPVLLIHHRLGEADEAAVLTVVHVDVTGLAGVHDGWSHLA